MRRTRLILAFMLAAIAPTIAFVTPPAAAHVCTNPVEIDVAKHVVVTIGVGAEEKPVRVVDISVPDGFDLDEPIGYRGYSATIDGTWVHFEGAEIAPYSCSYFSFAGRATRKGRLVAKIVTTAADGSKAHYNELRPLSRFPAQLIFAGVPITSEKAMEESDGGPSIWLILAVVLLAGGGVVAAAYEINRRRISLS